VLADWLEQGRSIEDMADRYHPQGESECRNAQREQAASAYGSKELATRLKLWAFLDHGKISDLVHQSKRWTASEARRAQALVRSEKRVVSATPYSEALYPLQAISNTATPLVPYIVERLGNSNDMLAIFRLRNAPYDNIGLVLRRGPAQWQLCGLLALVD
jgi:hypothetical protein